MGRLLICKSCNHSTDKAARSCSNCNAVLQEEKRTAFGLLGATVAVLAVPSFLLLGVFALIPFMTGLVMASTGKAWSPVAFRLRTLKPDDYARLQLKPGSGAWFTPNVESLVAGVLLLVVLCGAGLYGWHLIVSNMSR